MITEFNTSLLQDLFSGTYETIWEVTDTDDEGNELDCNYDFQEFMKSIAEAYQGYQEKMVKELGIPWLTGIKFTGGTFSPHEYNFSTDSLDMELEIDRDVMLESVRKLKGAEFAQYLRDNYSSRDGFWSWTPDTYEEILKELETEGEYFQQSLGAVLNYIIPSKTLEDIELTVHETWACNGYMGLDYTKGII